MIVYTRARRYELMTWLPAASEYASFYPDRIFLEPSHPVEPLAFPDWQSVKNINPADISAMIPVKTALHGAVVVGWLPKYALSQCYLRTYFDRTIDLNDDHQAFYPITFTGVKYGAYKQTHPENDARTPESHSGVAPSVQALWSAANLCPHCGHPRGDHKILETEEVAAECAALHAEIMQISAQRHEEQRVMIGVLHVVDTMNGHRYGYVSLASPTHLWRSKDAHKIQGPLQAQIDACLYFAERKGYWFVDRLVTPTLDCSGQQAHQQANPQVHTCAAPKLLSRAISDIFPNVGAAHRAEIRIFMSEKWCRTPGFGGGPDQTAHSDWHTIDSCNKCRGIVPSMMCHYTNPYKKSDVGRN